MFFAGNAGSFFPATKVVSLRMTVLLLSAGLVILGFMGLYPAVILAVGLWRLAAWARFLTVICLWCTVLLPIGMLSPFSAGDIILAGQDPPNPSMILLRFLPIMVAALFGLHILGKYRGEFNRRKF